MRAKSEAFRASDRMRHWRRRAKPASKPAAATRSEGWASPPPMAMGRGGSRIAAAQKRRGQWTGEANAYHNKRAANGAAASRAMAAGDFAAAARVPAMRAMATAGNAVFRRDMESSAGATACHSKSGGEGMPLAGGQPELGG